VEPDDNDESEETEDGQHDLEDSDIQGDKAPEDDARTRAMRRGKINEDLLTTAESSPSRQDDDANVTAHLLLLQRVRQVSSLKKMTWTCKFSFPLCFYLPSTYLKCASFSL
jgi:hypothetical protein